MDKKVRKIYIVYYDWPNTSGNHAGMAYLAKMLSLKLNNVRIIRMFSFRCRSLKVLNLFYAVFLAFKFYFILNKGDKVFLMEYMAKSCFQDIIAKIMRLLNVKNEIYGLVHLSGTHLLEIYKSPQKILSMANNLNKIVVLGSSLADFFIKEIGFKNVVTTFHYVDTDYYKPIKLEQKNVADKLSVLCIGNIKRDFNRLKSIIVSLPEIHFNVCQGMYDLSGLLSKLPNVTLYGFLEEDKLLNLMCQNDISLSIMEDTVGSNVITTSLAVGLVSVVSDVGSIRDYCSNNDSFLCKTNDDFINSIKSMDHEREKVFLMRKNALDKSKCFSLDKFISFFDTCFCYEK